MEVGQCGITGLYGNLVARQLRHSWDLLSQLCPGMAVPWLVLRDFNEIFCQEEMQGIHDWLEGQIQQFRLVIDELALKEVKGLRPFFT